MNQNPVITLAADVFEHRRLRNENQAHALTVLHGLNQAFLHYMERHHGRQLTLVTPAVFLAEFPGALEALACAVELQQDLAERRTKCNPVWRKVFVRVGVNDSVSASEGNPSVPAIDFSSARLLTPAKPGGICLSRRVHELVRSQLDHGVCSSRGSAPEAFWRNIERLSGMLECENPDIVQISPEDLDQTRTVVTSEDFIHGDVYIDYPYEDAKFRFEKETLRIYRRFYGKREVEIPHDSRLYHEAISVGRPITRDEYFSD